MCGNSGLAAEERRLRPGGEADLTPEDEAAEEEAGDEGERDGEEGMLADDIGARTGGSTLGAGGEIGGGSFGARGWRGGHIEATTSEIGFRIHGRQSGQGCNWGAV